MLSAVVVKTMQAINKLQLQGMPSAATGACMQPLIKYACCHHGQMSHLRPPEPHAQRCSADDANALGLQVGQQLQGRQAGTRQSDLGVIYKQ